jgi:hypothetical protein
VSFATSVITEAVATDVGDGAVTGGVGMLAIRHDTALDTAVRQALRELTDAAEAFIADQSAATDPRCGLTQPVTVAEAERLNRAYHIARSVLDRLEP